MSAQKTYPSRELLLAALDYAPATGEFRWRARGEVRKAWNERYAGKPAGRVNDQGYLDIAINKVRYRAARVAWIIVYGTIPEGAVVDHINGDRSDNRISNLRLATIAQNTVNNAARRGGGNRGIARRGRRWIARIAPNGKEIYLGIFDSAEEAAAAYSRAAEHHFGEFARGS